MVNGWRIMHNWLSVPESVNQEVLQLIAVFRKYSQHRFTRADNVSGRRAKMTEKSLGIVFRAKFHSQFDQSCKFQSGRPQRIQFAMFPGFDSGGSIPGDRSVKPKCRIYFLENLLGLRRFGDYVRHPVRVSDGPSFALMI